MVAVYIASKWSLLTSILEEQLQTARMASQNIKTPSSDGDMAEARQHVGGSEQLQAKKTVEQLEEEKLRAKYPNFKGGPLQKRLVQKGKYFDSGDYNMAKAAINNPKKPLQPQEKMLLQETIGEGIPTPEDLPPRKPSIVQSKLASGALS